MNDWIDVTRVLHDGSTGWPGDPPFRLRAVPGADDVLEAGAAAQNPNRVMVTEISTSAHIGTHVDAPLHCFAAGADIADVSLARLCGPAMVLDVPGLQDVSIDDLRGGGIRPGDRVLLRLRSWGDGQDALWPSEAGAGPCRAILPQSARWLIEQGVVLVGLDVASPDAPEDESLPVHRLLLGAGIPIVENLDLSGVMPGRYDMVALPLRIAGCEASPARVLVRPCP